MLETMSDQLRISGLYEEIERWGLLLPVTERTIVVAIIPTENSFISSQLDKRTRLMATLETIE
jgi:hypothetical protein